MQSANLAELSGEEEVYVARDRRAFEDAYGQHFAAVYSIALAVLGNVAQAQDVVQDVFLRLWRHPERFEPARGTLGNYLRLMARSRALDVWRETQIAARARERMKAIVRNDEGRAEERPALAAELRRERAVVLGALSRLPPPQRQAIVMAYWGGLTADQIARRSGIPVGTVKSRIRLGLSKLRERCEAQLAAGLPQAA